MNIHINIYPFGCVVHQYWTMSSNLRIGLTWCMLTYRHSLDKHVYATCSLVWVSIKLGWFVIFTSHLQAAIFYFLILLQYKNTFLLCIFAEFNVHERICSWSNLWYIVFEVRQVSTGDALSHICCHYNCKYEILSCSERVYNHLS